MVQNYVIVALCITTRVWRSAVSLSVCLSVDTALFYHKMVAKNRIETGLN